MRGYADKAKPVIQAPFSAKQNQRSRYEDVVEPVDTADLKSAAFGHAGSIPAVLTTA